MDHKSSDKKTDTKDKSSLTEKEDGQASSDHILNAHATGDGAMGRTEEEIPDLLAGEHEKNKRENKDY
jgi:hypothetical protein